MSNISSYYKLIFKESLRISVSTYMMLIKISQNKEYVSQLFNNIQIVQYVLQTMSGFSQLLNINQTPISIDTAQAHLLIEKQDDILFTNEYYLQPDYNFIHQNTKKSFDVYTQTWPNNTYLYRDEINQIVQKQLDQVNSTYQNFVNQTYPIKISKFSSYLNQQPNITVPLQFVVKFQNISNQVPVQCIQRQSNYNWTNQTCQTMVLQVDKSEVTCICQTPGTTTVISSIEKLITNQNVQKIFNQEGFTSIAQLSNWYEYLPVWTVIIMSVLFVALCIMGVTFDFQDKKILMKLRESNLQLTGQESYINQKQIFLAIKAKYLPEKDSFQENEQKKVQNFQESKQQGLSPTLKFESDIQDNLKILKQQTIESNQSSIFNLQTINISPYHRKKRNISFQSPASIAHQSKQDFKFINSINRVNSLLPFMKRNQTSQFSYQETQANSPLQIDLQKQQQQQQNEQTNQFQKNLINLEKINQSNKQQAENFNLRNKRKRFSNKSDLKVTIREKKSSTKTADNSLQVNQEEQIDDFSSNHIKVLPVIEQKNICEHQIQQTINEKNTIDQSKYIDKSQVQQEFAESSFNVNHTVIQKQAKDLQDNFSIIYLNDNASKMNQNDRTDVSIINNFNSINQNDTVNQQLKHQSTSGINDSQKYQSVHIDSAFQASFIKKEIYGKDSEILDINPLNNNESVQNYFQKQSKSIITTQQLEKKIDDFAQNYKQKQQLAKLKLQEYLKREKGLYSNLSSVFLLQLFYNL
ncbi:hypothetical protein ABPG73_003458 [Tetrahymena malaccensis]